MKKRVVYSVYWLLLILLTGFSSIFLPVKSQSSSSNDASVMMDLKKSLNPPASLGWSEPDPCLWNHVFFSGDKRVTRIQIGRQNLRGTLPSTLQNLIVLERLELKWNNICLVTTSLVQYPVTSIISKAACPTVSRALKFNLYVHGQQSSSKLSGGIDVIQNMTALREVWLHSNAFSGPLRDFSGSKDLQTLSLRDNKFTGPVPASLSNLGSLIYVNLSNNLFQGPTPSFK